MFRFIFKILIILTKFIFKSDKGITHPLEMLLKQFNIFCWDKYAAFAKDIDNIELKYSFNGF